MRGERARKKLKTQALNRNIVVESEEIKINKKE